MVGIDNKIDNLAASALSRQTIRPAVRTIPDRLTPGIKAKACAIPIKKYPLKLIWSILL